MAVADDDNNIVMWDLAAEVETKRLAASGKVPAVFLQWNANTSMALVSVSAHGVVASSRPATSCAASTASEGGGGGGPPEARLSRSASGVHRSHAFAHISITFHRPQRPFSTFVAHFSSVQRSLHTSRFANRGGGR